MPCLENAPKTTDYRSDVIRISFVYWEKMAATGESVLPEGMVVGEFVRDLKLR
jgi:hypothetical protein